MAGKWVIVVSLWGWKGWRKTSSWLQTCRRWLTGPQVRGSTLWQILLYTRNWGQSGNKFGKFSVIWSFGLMGRNFFLLFWTYFVCMGVFSACISVHYTWRPTQGVGFLGTGVTAGSAVGAVQAESSGRTASALESSPALISFLLCRSFRDSFVITLDESQVFVTTFQGTF